MKKIKVKNPLLKYDITYIHVRTRKEINKEERN